MQNTISSLLKGRVYASLTASTNSGPGRHQVRVHPNERGGVSIAIGDDIYISVDDPSDWDRIDSAVQDVLASMYPRSERVLTNN